MYYVIVVGARCAGSTDRDAAPNSLDSRNDRWRMTRTVN
jgi:hypothetical protein